MTHNLAITGGHGGLVWYKRAPAHTTSGHTTNVTMVSVLTVTISSDDRSPDLDPVGLRLKHLVPRFDLKSFKKRVQVSDGTICSKQ